MAAAFKHRFLPLSALGEGVIEGDWIAAWLECRKSLGLEFGDGYPRMPVPDNCGRPTVRALSSSEFGAWANWLLDKAGLLGDRQRVSSHSCKCTCLSFAAKRGASHSDRLVLGYHSSGLSAVLGYSRDAAVRPMQVLGEILKAIRDKRFDPDAGRAERFSEPTLRVS